MRNHWFQVKYAPKVTVSIISGTAPNGRIPEGAEVHIGCHADANPAEVTYRWFLGDKLLVGDYTTELILHNVTREHHDQIVKCEVHNVVGKSEESETLDISCKSFISSLFNYFITSFDDRLISFRNCFRWSTLPNEAKRYTSRSGYQRNLIVYC